MFAIMLVVLLIVAFGLLAARVKHSRIAFDLVVVVTLIILVILSLGVPNV